VIDASDAKSRSRRCHNVWHEPRSNWTRWESTGAYFTLKLAESGMMSVGRARFKSPLAHTFLAWNRSPANIPLRGAPLPLCIYLTCAKGGKASRLLPVHAGRRSNSLG
jgi:hypothetical protein